VKRVDAAGIRGGDRMLSFEVEAIVYAMPIAAILEVAETDRVTCVPGLPPSLAGVMNWQGDALPIVASLRLLLEEEARTRCTDSPDREAIAREQVLVLSNRSGESARMGLPVDRVVGLVDGTAARGRSASPVVERRQVGGRVISVLDPKRLLARAEEMIERAVV